MKLIPGPSSVRQVVCEAASASQYPSSDNRLNDKQNANLRGNVKAKKKRQVDYRLWTIICPPPVSGGVGWQKLKSIYPFRDLFGLVLVQNDFSACLVGKASYG